MYLEEEIPNVPLPNGHVDFFWHGVHGIELLLAAMGPGCVKVGRASSADTEVCVGVWDDGRTATYRGSQSSDEYGGTVATEEGEYPLGPPELSPESCLPQLLDEVVRFFRTGEPVVSAAETVEIYAFMAACDASKARGGAEVSLEEVLRPAREMAQVVLDRHWYKPSTLSGRSAGGLGSAPFLAVVSDARAAIITAEAILTHHSNDPLNSGDHLDVAAVLAMERIGVETDWNGTLTAACHETGGRKWPPRMRRGRRC